MDNGERALVQVEAHGAVRVLVLDDPDRRNALGLPLRRQLVTTLDDAIADAECRAIVLTGAGHSFSAGGDLAAMPPTDFRDLRHRIGLLADIVRLLVRGTKPTVAAVNGYAAGAGLSIAAACDHVVASPEARFVCSFVNIGLAADAGLTWTLPARIGPGRARTMLLFGEQLEATEAHRIGLVDHLSAGEDALPTALERAHQLARGAPLPLAAMKETLGRWPASLDDVLAREQQVQEHMLFSNDFLEGKSAFYERRSPSFHGT